MEQQKFKNLIIELKKYDESANAWLDSIPREINSVFFDNPYVDSLQHTKELLLASLFDKPLIDEVEWFLYEWSENKDESLRTITYPDGSKYVINNVDDFVQYLKAEGQVT